MPGLADSIKLWTVALFYGVVVLLSIIKRLFTKGPSKLFDWKQLSRPHYIDDPSLGTHGFLTLKDVRIHYVASGPEDKPLMLFVHGFPEFWYSWRYQLREFQKDYRVVAIDQRGYSDSSKPSGIENYSVLLLMTDLEQIIQALGYKSCVLVGHDWGGLVVWAFARNYSHMVDKLIVMNAPTYSIFKRFVNTNRNQARKSWYVFFFQLPFLPELALKLENFAFLEDLLPTTNKSRQGSKDDSKALEENIGPYRYMFSQPGALTPPLNYYRNMLRHDPDKLVCGYDLDYSMPVLLIWGCNDIAIENAVADAVEKEAPKVEVKRIAGASHFVQIDAPDEVNKIMTEFLNKNQ